MAGDETDDQLERFLRGHREVLPPPSLPIGTEVGPWRITGLLGRGGSAEVYCARNRETDGLAAVKVLHREDEASRRRFELEGRILATIQDNAFPRLLGTGETETGRPYLALELLEPLDLPKGGWRTARYLTSVAKGVAALHRLGYVHRDIKPRNILSRGACAPVVIDLGLVKDITDRSGPAKDRLSIVNGKAVGVGTPRYAAPEQFTSGDATPATDIHALGMLAYDCFGGHPPASWRKIIRRATSTIPEERFQSVSEFIRAVRSRNLPVMLATVSFFLVLGAFSMWRITASSHEVAAGAPAIRDLPREFELGGQDVVWAEPVRLRGDGVYRVIGPGRLDANLFSDDGARLWATNCTIVNRTRKPYPGNSLRYELAGDVYLNLANCPELPHSLLRACISTPDGPGKDLNRDGVGPRNNDIRFQGPADRQGLVSLKNLGYFKNRGR